MNDPTTQKPFRAREAITQPRLSRTVLRSSAPGYLLAAAAAAVVVGAIGWKVVRQGEAIHTAETRAPGVAQPVEPSGAPSPVLVELPADTAAAEATSRVQTTGALVPAPSVTTPPAPLPVAPVASLPPAKPEHSKATSAAPARPAAVRHAPRKRPQHASSRPSSPDVPDTDDNPYATPQAPAEAPSAAPTADDPDHLFDVRD